MDLDLRLAPIPRLYMSWYAGAPRGNAITLWGTISSSGVEYQLSVALNSLDSFRGGNPFAEAVSDRCVGHGPSCLAGNRLPGLWIARIDVPACLQVFYVYAPVTSDWPPGQERTFYLYSPLAATSAQSRMSVILFRAYNNGLVSKGFVNQNDASRFQIALTLVNAGFQTIPAGFQYRFGVQVGP